MTGKKITGRTKQLSLKSTPEFHQRLKETAVKEKCLMIEVLEKAMELYEREKNKAVKKDAMPQAPSFTRKHSRDEDEELNTDFKKIKIV